MKENWPGCTSLGLLAALPVVVGAESAVSLASQQVLGWPVAASCGWPATLGCEARWVLGRPVGMPMARLAWEAAAEGHQRCWLGDDRVELRGCCLRQLLHLERMGIPHAREEAFLRSRGPQSRQSLALKSVWPSGRCRREQSSQRIHLLDPQANRPEVRH